jgi:hypothetical protein
VSPYSSTRKSPGTRGALVWGDGVFATKRELKAWLRIHGGKYTAWQRHHPAAAALVRPGRPPASARRKHHVAARTHHVRPQRAPRAHTPQVHARVATKPVPVPVRRTLEDRLSPRRIVVPALTALVVLLAAIAGFSARRTTRREWSTTGGDSVADTARGSASGGRMSSHTGATGRNGGSLVRSDGNGRDGSDRSRGTRQFARRTEEFGPDPTPVGTHTASASLIGALEHSPQIADSATREVATGYPPSPAPAASRSRPPRDLPLARTAPRLRYALAALWFGREGPHVLLLHACASLLFCVLAAGAGWLVVWLLF